MKTFFTIITLLVFINGCATKNAFSKFNITKEQEYSLENTRNGKIIDGEKVIGIYSVVYLNNIINTESKNQTEKFYISIYSKDKSIEPTILLNNLKSKNIKEYAKVNEFSYLLTMQNDWNKNYLISFDNSSKEKLNLSIDIGQFSSGQLNFLKDE